MRIRLFSFFGKQPKPRSFRHNPIYYDPQKEAMEERRLKAKKELGELTDEERQKLYRTELKGSFRENIPGGSSLLQAQLRKSRIRVVVIVTILILLLFFLTN